MDDFVEQINRLDLNLFKHIKSQTTLNDKISLLAIHLASRQIFPQFNYLEIGSHLGGSLQSYVVDTQCVRIVSIDPRPLSQPDERGTTHYYQRNSTARMLGFLKAIPGANVDKIHAIDAGTDTISPADIPCKPDVCFIDGEHTDTAVIRDAQFCLSVVNPNGCLVFHDSNIVYGGLDRFIQNLTQANQLFRAYNLPDSVFVIELGSCRFRECKHIREMLDNNYKGYLWSLLATDPYREFYRRPLFRGIRNIRSKVGSILNRGS